MNHDSTSRPLSKGPCPNTSCGSSDAFVDYDDGHGYCFSCNTYTVGDSEQEKPEPESVPSGFVAFDVQGLKSRKISQKVCERYKYGVGKDRNNRTVQVANYYDPSGRELVAQKLRTRDKEFVWLGKSAKAGLFGQHLFSPYSRIVITEGEIDALSVATAFDQTRMPVVSIRNGAGNAEKEVREHLDYLTKFKKVIICFDSDEQGTTAAEEVAAVLPPGVAHIAHLNGKDANDVLLERGADDLRQAIWNAQEWRPDGVLATQAIWDRACELHSNDSGTYALPWSELNEATDGWRRGEIFILCGGTGTGKSAVMKELGVYFRQAHGLNIGYLGLEENTKQIVLDMISVKRSERLRRKMIGDLSLYYSDYEELFGNDGIVLYDHFGSLGPENLLDRMRYMIRAYDLPFIFLDHISIAISGLQSDNERQTLDYLITQLRSLAEETQAGIGIISHLRRPSNGKAHEEGGQTSLNQLRGSHALSQLADTVVGLERNQQAQDGSELETKIRLLKCRWTGETGLRGALLYNRETGRLTDDGDSPFVDETAGDSHRGEDF